MMSGRPWLRAAPPWRHWPLWAALSGLGWTGAVHSAPLALNGWEVPPIAYSGTVGLGYIGARFGDQPWSRGLSAQLSLNWSSYVYAPWLLTVSGQNELGLVQQYEPRLGQGDTRYLTGLFRFQFLPRTPYPLDISFRLSDSRMGGVNPPSVAPAKSSEINMAFHRQVPNAADSYNLRFNHLSIDGRQDTASPFGRTRRVNDDRSTSLSGDYATRWPFHMLNATVNINDVSRRSELTEWDSASSSWITRFSDSESLFVSASAAHQYAHEDKPYTLTSNLSANYIQESGMLLGQSTTPVEVASVQAFSHWVYRPEIKGLGVNGSVRGLLLNNMANDQQLSNAVVSVGASYDGIPKWRLQTGANAGYLGQRSSLDPGVNHQLSLGGNVDAQWLGREWVWNEWRYVIQAGGGGSTSVVNFVAAAPQVNPCIDFQSCPTQRMWMGSAAFSFNQQLRRTWVLSENSQLLTTAAQNLGPSSHVSHEFKSIGDGVTQLNQVNLVHSASMSWNRSEPGQTASAYLAINDSRALAGDSGNFTMLSANVSGEWQFQHAGTLRGSVGYQWSTSTLSQSAANLLRISTQGLTGDLSYQKNNLFGVPRLRYEAKWKQTIDPRSLGGSLNLDRSGKVLENNLYFLVGRLQAKLTHAFISIEGGRRQQLNLQVMRAFGG